jgi:hypothetical protein
MPAIVVPNEGSLELANTLFSVSLPSTYRYLVDLFGNQYTPVQTSTASDFEIMDFPGYAQVQIARSQWTPAVLAGGQAFVSYASNPVAFNNNGVQAGAWGYLVRSSVSGSVLWCQAYDSVQLIGLGSTLTQDIDMLIFGSNP